MTNTLAVIFAVLIIGIFTADYFYFHWDLWLIIGRRLAQMIEYIAFWR
ncbi:hypothetical protein [Profundibacter sp.]